MLLRRGAAALFALLAGGPALAGWLDTPDHLQLEPVGDALVVNGMPIQIRTFTAALPMKQLLEEVRIGWERHPDRTSVTRTTLGDWTVLNQRVGQQQRSLQVRPVPGGIEGRVSLSSPKEAREPRVAIQLPASMTAVSVIDSVDAGRRSQQVIALSNRSADATAAALEATLKAQGWQRHVMQRAQGGLLFSANRGSQEFDANISAQKNGALVMMNTIIGNK